MKRATPETPASAPRATTGKDYWRGLEELADTPEFRRHLENEFPSETSVISDPVSRRKFLGLMGAAIALSGVTGCSRPLARILPYAKLPEDLLPGVPQSYATVFPFRGVVEGVLVTSNEGRPTKVEGNPTHPGSRGATHLWTQASILNLYDPDRSKFPITGSVRRSWDEFETWVRPRLRELRGNGGAGLRFLSPPTASPATRALRAEMTAAYPQARWHEYEPIHRDAAVAGSRLAFGRPLRTQLSLDQADVILSLDSDFLQTEPDSVRNAWNYASRRRVTSEKDSMNRLYQVESGFSVTGVMADHRLRRAHSQIAELARAVAFKLRRHHGVDLSGADIQAPGALGELEAWVTAVAKDLAGARGRAVVIAGASQPAEVHALAHLMNRGLGSVGTVVRYTQEPYPGEQTASIADLARDLAAGRVEMLVVVDGNPAYDAPADLEFVDAMDKAKAVVRLGLYQDETSASADWHLPLCHYLESWGDGESWDGTRSVQQPLIAPLYEGKSENEFLALLLDKKERDGHEVVRSRYGDAWGSASLDDRWDRALNDGLIAGSAYPEVTATPNGSAVAAAWAARTAPTAPSAEALEVVFRPDLSVYDGSVANNGWLQELPDNMSKITWDNAACLSPRTAKELGVQTDDLVTLSVGGRELTLAALVAPGLADYTVELPLGYGRTQAGRIGNGIGFNTYLLRQTGGMTAASKATLRRAGGTYKLVATQTHQVMEGRPLIREATLEEYRKEPHFVEEMAEVPPLVTLYTDREYNFNEGHQWGMSIDLNTCIGCNACTVACQSENNIAIVGKDQVQRGREMHWIRLDRYYAGDPEEPEATHQPLPCMQCENAPCETVCPVNATSHSDEGLNQMTYNRCIGTRYCNNNCPYKVRRFNYYDWRKDFTEVEKMAMNPDVTVRMRGVMEKCTYCIQRINRKKIDAKNAKRPLADGEIVTACQQVCPTGSIVFGDIKDPESRVVKLKAQNRDYTILKELNTRPRTTYLARLRNPNPELEHVS